MSQHHEFRFRRKIVRRVSLLTGAVHIGTVAGIEENQYKDISISEKAKKIVEYDRRIIALALQRELKEMDL